MSIRLTLQGKPTTKRVSERSSTLSPVPATTFTPTAEQDAALTAFGTGGSLVIEAGAGSGKTSTLRLLAQARPRQRGLYIAYNKSIQLDAAKSFPANITCKTAHALAYPTHGVPMRHRLNGGRVPGWKAAQILQAECRAVDGTVLSETAIARLAMQAVERFCRSSDTEIDEQHYRTPVGLEDAKASALNQLALEVVILARRAWADLCNPRGQLKFQHDHYLKQWALAGYRLPYDFILFDEAQDADPCIAGVVKRQMKSAQVVMVGDAAQAIYGWRGAIDVLSNTEVDHRTRLTQSFRFGDRVATEANQWLREIGSNMRLTGNPKRESRVVPLDRPDAVLCRTNARTIQEVMTAQKREVKVALVGGGTDIKRLAEAAMRLQNGEPAGHPDLVAFETWTELQDYVKQDPEGSDLATAVNLIDAHGAATVLGAIDGCRREQEAELVISTAHKAKGREWPTVRIADDFKEPPTFDDGSRAPIARADAMLAYVSVTRAMDRLDNHGLAWIWKR